MITVVSFFVLFSGIQGDFAKNEPNTFLFINNPSKIWQVEENRLYLQKKEDKMEWFENLPQYCPPKDAVPCNGKFYRIADGDPATSEDFFSQRKLQPNKIFKGQGIDECITRALSVFKDISDAKKRLKLPKFRHSQIACVELSDKDGMIKKTFTDSHYSWWRSKEFNVEQAKIVKQ